MFNDAVELLALVERSNRTGYDDTAVGTVLSGAVTFVDRLANSECLTAT